MKLISSEKTTLLLIIETKTGALRLAKLVLTLYDFTNGFSDVGRQWTGRIVSRRFKPKYTTSSFKNRVWIYNSN